MSQSCNKDWVPLYQTLSHARYISVYPASRGSGKRVPEVLCVSGESGGLQEVGLPPHLSTNPTFHTSCQGVCLCGFNVAKLHIYQNSGQLQILEFRH